MPATDSLQTRKLCSAYGGVGSLIESRLGALRILSANEWPYLRGKSPRAYREENRLNDIRLLARLRCLFPELRRLARMPSNPPLAFAGAPSRPRVAVDFFPKWMYCPSCARFDHHANWRRQWYLTATRKTAFEVSRFEEAPRCDYCFHNDKLSGPARWQTLEQVRFVMTSPAGSIADVPWPHWALRHRQEKETAAPEAPHDDATTPEEAGEASTTTLAMQRDLPKGTELYYRTSGRLNDLKGITIEARRRLADGGTERLGSATLSGLFGLRVPETDMEEYGVERPRRGVPMKPVLRASNSVYYPHIVQSLYLPGEQPEVVGTDAQGPSTPTGLTQAMAQTLRENHEDEMPVHRNLKRLFDKHGVELSTEQFEELLAAGFVIPAPAPAMPPVPEPSLPGEEDYRRAEYQYITTQATPADAKELLLRPLDLTDAVPGLGPAWQLDRLKMTAVQTSYTRQQPLDRDAVLAQDEKGNPLSIRRRFTFKYGLKTHTLLGVESYGEGLFFTLNAERLRQWENKPSVLKRLDQLLANQGAMSAGSPGAARKATARFVLLHTLSHLLVRELEFQCGYPATSLQERLYVGPQMQGLLIYTIAGSEGSYGGLVSLGRTGRLPGLFQSALQRATDCAADPICWHTDAQGQGVGGLNLAACAACALLPETSCEEFNSLLDRRLVVDPEFGFFANNQSS
ncbi:DUF1998 domain-containing protein [Hymenobacter sp. DG25B]|uniref:DUF1998 domain-containing protein n=1 Tax=Hymenobacter sp. DG25B TaxID=1385664 RepID=UPI00066280EB|nr:DUF1998 domain-containing protein [Hymenobacter sp. DG25B]